MFVCHLSGFEGLPNTLSNSVSVNWDIHAVSEPGSLANFVHSFHFPSLFKFLAFKKKKRRKKGSFDGEENGYNLDSSDSNLSANDSNLSANESRLSTSGFYAEDAASVDAGTAAEADDALEDHAVAGQSRLRNSSTLPLDATCASLTEVDIDDCSSKTGISSIVDDDIDEGPIDGDADAPNSSSRQYSRLSRHSSDQGAGIADDLFEHHAATSKLVSSSSSASTTACDDVSRRRQNYQTPSTALTVVFSGDYAGKKSELSLDLIGIWRGLMKWYRLAWREKPCYVCLSISHTCLSISHIFFSWPSLIHFGYL